MMTSPLLRDRVAIVTGAAQGLGYAIAETFATAGASVVLADLDAERALAAAHRLGIGERAVGVSCDVTRESDMTALVAHTATRFGRLDIMVNNAGVTHDATMRKMSAADFDLVIDVNLKGAWLGTRAAADYMRDHGGGSIINMSSIAGKVGNPGQTNYSAAKAGIIGLTKAAAKEVGFAGVRINALLPGIIDTPMTATLPNEVRQQRLRDVPLQRFGTPHEVAQAALFLASDMASYITGTTIEVAGGRHT